MADLIGLAIWNFLEGSLANRIERCAKAGFNAVSLSGGDACALCKGATPEVENAIMKHSLAVAFHPSFMAGDEIISSDILLADFESFVKWNQRTCALHTVNYDAATGLVNGVKDYLAYEMHHVLKKMLSMSNGEGFSVGVEDWPRNNGQLDDVYDLQAYSHYGMLLDLGHMNMRVSDHDNPDLPFSEKAARLYLDRINLPINELHVHNNDGKRDLHSSPSAGTADMKTLGAMLRRRGVQGISTIELVPAWNGMDDEEGWKAAEDALDFWNEVF